MIIVNPKHLTKIVAIVPVFCSIAVLSTQLHATPTVRFSADNHNMLQSGKVGYVGGNTRLGVSVDKNLQGQADLSQVIDESESSLTSADLWLGYQLKDNDSDTKGAKGGGVKLNHHWVGENKDRVHKVFGAYDRNKSGYAKATVGYGQEQEDLFWSGHISKGLGKKDVSGDLTTRAYDYGVGLEAGTFIDNSLTRVRGGIDYEFGTDYNDSESRPENLTISAGLEQFFQDSPHSISLDVSGSKSAGGNNDNNTNYNARLGYHYEFGGNGVFQSATRKRNVRVEIPGTSGRPAIPAIAGTPAQPAIPAKYERRLVKRPRFKLVKTTMKLENETFFKKNSSQLTTSAIQNLNRITQQIRASGYLGAIRITGNTCGLGNARYDQKLSEKRAKNVRNYLISQGFNPNHLIARGLGKNNPKYVAKNTGFKNRRVDIEYVTERSARKATEYRNVLVQKGRPAIPATPGRIAVPAVSGTPARYVWKTEAVKSAPIWVKRALHNSIRHNKTVSTYTTRSQQKVKVTNDRFTINSNNALLDVLGNDSPNLTLQSVTQPNHGQVEIIGGKIRYIPNPGFSGTDTFTYTVRDANGKLITATVTVNVPNIVNHVPVANDDTISTNQNNEVIIDVLSNDTDADGGQLSIHNFTNPSHGTVTIANGKLKYVPDHGYTGNDSFTYTTIDNAGNISNPATVRVSIVSTNTAPVAVNDIITTNENTAITINVLNNDNDADGDTLSVVGKVTDPSNGTIVLNADGTFTYTPNANYFGTDSFDYKITDGNGHEVTAMVTITITNVNVAPVAVNDTATTPENTPVTIHVVQNDTDADGDSLTIKAGSLTNPTNGTVRLSGNDIIYTPNNGFDGIDTFQYTITDPSGLESTTTVTVNVNNVNAAPVAVDDRAITPENTSVTINVVQNDTDADGDTLTVKAGSLTNPAHGTVRINGNNITYTPNNGFDGTDTFQYTITDPSGVESTATVVVTVNNVNVAPVATDDSATTDENTAVIIDVLNNDSDADGDTLSVVGKVTDPSNGTIVLNADGTFTYTPNANYSGTDSFDYKITDGNGHEVTAMVTITVTNTNVAPVATDDSETTDENTAVTINVLNNDSDADGDTLSVVGKVTDPSNGTVTLNADGTFTYTPNINFSGTDSFDYKITDGNGHEVTATVNITVNDTNQPPVANDDSITMDTNDSAVDIYVLNNDSDPDGGTVCVNNIKTDPVHGWVEISQNGDYITYHKDAGWEGQDSFDYIACDDNNGSSNPATVTITVTSP